MEQTQKKYGKEMIGYGENKHDYVSQDEITVTITLAEYRELVEKNATRHQEIEKINAKMNEKDREIQRLKDKIERMLVLDAKTDEEEPF